MWMGEIIVDWKALLGVAVCLLAAGWLLGGWWIARQAAALRRARQTRNDAEQQLAQWRQQTLELQQKVAEGNAQLAQLEADLAQLREDAAVRAAEHSILQQRARLLEEQDSALRAEAELRRHQLEEAEHAVVEANRTKSLFVANMSHELRTPLNGILGLTRSLLDSSLSPRQQSEVELIHLAGEDLMRIVNDILDLSKLEASKFTLEAIPFHLGELLEGVFRLLYPQAARKHLSYALCYSPTMRLRYLGDPFRIRQVVLNLLSNAIKFTPSGHVYLHAKELTGANGATTLLLEFEDSGIGIGADKQRVIFEEFEQADLSTTRRFGGTGLGLSISRRVIRLMGGDITLESESGRGSTFKVQIPLQSITPLEDAAPAAAGSIPAAPRIQLLAQNRYSPEMLALKRLLDSLPGVSVQQFQQGSDLVALLQQQGAERCDAIVTCTGALAVWDDAALAELQRQGPAGPPLIVLRDHQGEPPRYPAGAPHRVELEPPVLPSQLFQILKQIERKPLGPLFEAAGMTAFDLLPDQATPRIGSGTVVVAHESPVERRRLEGLAEKLGLHAVACADSNELAQMLAREPVSAAIVQSSLLTTQAQVVLWRLSSSADFRVRLLVTGTLDIVTRSQLAASPVRHTYLPESPRLAQLREALMEDGRPTTGLPREISGRETSEG